MKTPAFIKLVSQTGSINQSVMEQNIFPGERIPWHYHTEFSETFEVIKGTLEVGAGKDIFKLYKV